MGKMTYRVNLNYFRFDFDDPITAGNFAELAKANFSGGGYDNKMDVVVEYLTKDEATKAQEGNE